MQFKIHYFWKLIGKEMKKIIIPVMVVAIIIALCEQVSAEKNVYVMVIAIVVFMMGMMQLSAKIPSKNQENEDENV